MSDLPQSEQSLLIGFQHADDAAVVQLSDTLALVKSLDFFMPIVDDPFIFGQIAACNALSDIYAMGATPILALAILGFPIKKMDASIANLIMKGGSDICTRANVPLAGGHSIDDTEPKFGLSVSGTVHPQEIWTNTGVRPGDHLILTKALGIGAMGSAIKQSKLSSTGYQEFIQSTTTLNDAAARAGRRIGIHTATDITGFGLIGHTLELAKASHCNIRIFADALPIYPEAKHLIQNGVRPGATRRNLQFAEAKTTWGTDIRDLDKWILADPQTSGGLLLSVPASQSEALIEACHEEGTLFATKIGVAEAGSGRLDVIRGAG